jgi:peptide/nickel transport system permease protein
LAILAVAVFGVGLGAPIVAIAIAYVPYIARLVRGAGLRERRLPYVEAATVQGLGGWYICRRHLLPNLMPLVIAQATISFGYAMVDLAAISFLGLGVQPPTADWGAMVAEGQASILRGYPQEALFSGTLIVLAVMAFLILGERITARSERGR